MHRDKPHTFQVVESFRSTAKLSNEEHPSELHRATAVAECAGREASVVGQHVVEIPPLIGELLRQVVERDRGGTSEFS
ncbi:hypothetical protein WK24_29080 [Burkholderia vietnamiensis]|nr:hypothetical protein WK24_29080 [Burkholderia vietnamiensis]